MFVQRPKKNALVINLLLVLKTSEFKVASDFPEPKKKSMMVQNRRTNEEQKSQNVTN
jgi:hypothetical protein